MRRLLLNAAALLALAALAPAALAQQHQGGRLNLDSLDRLAPLAVTFHARADKTADGKGTVYVREFEFKGAGAYRPSDLDAVRAQVRAPGWSQMMRVEDREDPGDEETVEIYVYTEKVGSRVRAGMLIIDAEPTELAVVNIVGEGDATKLIEQIRRGEARKKARPGRRRR